MIKWKQMCSLAVASPIIAATLQLQRPTNCAPSQAALAEIVSIRAKVHEASGDDSNAGEARFDALSNKLTEALIRTQTVMLEKHQVVEVLDINANARKVRVKSGLIFRKGILPYRSDGIRFCYIPASAK